VQEFSLDVLGNFVALITVGITAAFALKSQDFSVCWLGIHTFQVLRFLPLINVVMHDGFAGFMRGCEFYNPIPNLFSLFYDED
jgi:hypothetical protein